jgi:hypothetical protein
MSRAAVSDLLTIVLFVLGYIVVMRWVLPKFGVPT